MFLYGLIDVNCLWGYTSKDMFCKFVVRQLHIETSKHNSTFRLFLYGAFPLQKTYESNSCLKKPAAKKKHPRSPVVEFRDKNPTDDFFSPPGTTGPLVENNSTLQR